MDEDKRVPDLPPIPPPPYESIVSRDNSIKHVYLTPGPMSEEEESGYLEPSSQCDGDRDSGHYTSIDEMGTYSDIENNVYQGQTIINPTWVNPHPPKSAAPPTQLNRKRRCIICAIVIGTCVGLIVLLTAVSFAILLFTGNMRSQSVKAGPETNIDLTESSTERTTKSSDIFVWPTSEVPKTNETCSINTDLLGIAIPDYNTNTGYTTYNCHVCPPENCVSEVHMIAMYKPEGSITGFQQEPSFVPDVPVNVVSIGQHSPLIFVLSSFGATNWVIKVTSDVTVAHVFLMSYRLSDSSAKVIDENGEELTNYRLHLSARPRNYLDYKGTGQGSSKGIEEITRTLTSQYGCLTSFAGRYVAKSWTLNLDRRINCGEQGIISTTVPPSSTTEMSATEHKDCSTDPCQNDATCTEAGAGPFHCFCSWPYYGQRCENVNRADTCDINNNLFGTATPVVSGNGGYTTHNCNKCPQNSCVSEVHMIAMYEPEGSVRGFQQEPSVVPDVQVDVTGNRNHLPVTLVLSSYEATSWVINLPDDITVAHVFLMSYYQSHSSVKVLNSNGTEDTSYELHVPATSHYYMDHRGTGPPSTYSFGYGCSSCKGVDNVTSTMTSRYGCFTSFSGRYVAKSWTLNLDSNNCG